VLVVPGRLDTSYVTGTRWPRCISPSSFAVHARNDRVAVRRYFSRNDVPEYWIVDCDGRAFERWRPHDERPELYRSD
jgi:Uma2 family endonuclease